MPTTDTRVLTAPKAPFFASLPPLLTGFLRGVTLAVIVGGIEGAVHFLDTSQTLPPDIAIAAPLLVLLLRSIEGYIDHHSMTTGAAVATDAGPAPEPAPPAPTPVPEPAAPAQAPAPPTTTTPNP